MDWNRPGKLIRPNPDWEEDLFQTVVVGPAEEARVNSYTAEFKKRKPKKECCCQDQSSPGVAPRITLNNGQTMPSLGIGTWLGLDKKGNPVIVTDLSVQYGVENAIDAGYRLIDTAYRYRTEKQVGMAIKNKIAEGVVRREDLYVITKTTNLKFYVATGYWMYIKEKSSDIITLMISIEDKVINALANDVHVKDAVVPGLKKSLADLNLEYVDMFLIHWPVGVFEDGAYDNTDYLETWQGMIEARARALTKGIGLSNFNQHQIDRIMSLSKTKPAVLQVEINLNNQQPSLLSFCMKHNIAVMAYTPFGSLFHWRAESDSPPPRIDSPLLIRIAEHYHKTVPQIVLRYLLELGVIPIPKSIDPVHIQENMEIFHFQLEKKHKDIFKKYDKNYRMLPVKFWMDSPYYPFEK